MARKRPHSRIAANVNLPVLVFREDSVFIAYTPALDLSSCGDTFEEAVKKFGEAVEIFLKECTTRGTLDNALASLGWRKTGKPSNGWVPPQVVGHLDIPIPATA